MAWRLGHFGVLFARWNLYISQGWPREDVIFPIGLRLFLARSESGIMQVLRSVLFSLLAATAVARPGGNGRQEAALQARGAKYAPKEPPLTTPWTDKVGTNPWPEYPRPQMQRSQWQNLNGVWQYRNASSLSEMKNPPFGQELGQEVLIPSCLESGLSGKL